MSFNPYPGLPYPRLLGTGVYFLISSADGRIVYVGKSTANVGDRITAHIGDKPFDKYLYLPIFDEGEVDKAETAFMRYLKPPLNSRESAYKGTAGQEEIALIKRLMSLIDPRYHGWFAPQPLSVREVVSPEPEPEPIVIAAEPPPPRFEYLSFRDLKDNGYPYSEAKISKDVKTGSFPKPVLFGRRRMWRLSDWQQWLNEQQ